jgi:hypothetical protein
MQSVRAHSIQLSGAQLQLLTPRRPNSVLPLKDYQIIWHDSSSPVSYLGLVAAGGGNEHSYRVEVENVPSFEATLKQLYSLVKQHAFRGGPAHGGHV